MSDLYQQLPARSQVTGQEKERLIVAILRDPKVCELAMEHLPPDTFGNAMEPHIEVMLASLYELIRDCGYAPGNVPHPALVGAINDKLEHGHYVVAPEYQAQLLGLPEGVAGTGESPGLLYRAYFETDPSPVDVPYARDLVRKVLFERTVIDPLRQALGRPDGTVPVGIQEVLETCRARSETIGAIGGVDAPSFEADWPGFLGWLDGHRGKALIGLKTGIPDLDDRTAGLRGLTVLGAMPNSGKTSLAVQVAAGVARNHEFNDAVVVFVSLDMGKAEIYARLLSHVAEMDWATVVQGSPELRGRVQGPFLTEEDAERLHDGMARMIHEQIRSRVRVYERSAIGAKLSASRLASILADAKAQAGAGRALLILDYLQLIEPPEDVQGLGDLAADKHRVQVVLDVVARTRTEENPDGDAVLAISEVRKPGDAKQGWGEQLADLMGAARTAYAADAVLLYRRMADKEVEETYHVTKDQVKAKREQLDAQGIAPMVLALAKGRDGMRRGDWPMEFLFRRSTWRRPEGSGPAVPTNPAQTPEGGTTAPIAPQPQPNSGQTPAPCSTQTGGMSAPAAQAEAQVNPNHRQKMLEALAAHPTGASRNKLAKHAKLNAANAKVALDQLVEEGLVEVIEVDSKVTYLLSAGVTAASPHPVGSDSLSDNLSNGSDSPTNHPDNPLLSGPDSPTNSPDNPLSGSDNLSLSGPDNSTGQPDNPSMAPVNSTSGSAA